MTFNDNKIYLSKIVTIKMQDKIRVRTMMNREPLNLHIMIRLRPATPKPTSTYLPLLEAPPKPKNDIPDS